MNEESKESMQLNIVVALSCEARPLLKHFRLKKNRSIATIPVYQNTDKSIFLIESGIGKIKSAAASAFLQAYTGNQSHNTFLNLGIAGSKDFEIGQAVIINKINDSSVKKAWYPNAMNISSMPQTHLLTVDQPTSIYPDQGVVDMEGAGFFQAATQLVTQEQVQLIKIVSDNTEEQALTIKSDRVESLIVENLTIIDGVVKKLLDLSKREQEIKPLLFEKNNFIEKWHFTQYQQNELSELLRRWQVNHPKQSAFSMCKDLHSAKTVLAQLTHLLDQLSYSWE